MIHYHRIILGVIVLLVFKGAPLRADNNLLYIEFQGVASYREQNDKIVWYSHHQHETMQKPSLGFDFVRRIRATGQDKGYLAIQARLAFDEHKNSKLEPQLYNAFYNFKIMRSDLWIGHNKTALGLSSYLDNHAQLMSDNSMSPLNFDRDWGIGFYTEKQFTDYRISLTTGSGMPLHLSDSFMLAARMGIGNLDRDNRNFGFSFAQGRILKTMGYHYMHNKKTHDVIFGCFDRDADQICSPVFSSWGISYHRFTSFFAGSGNNRRHRFAQRHLSIIQSHSHQADRSNKI